MKLKMSKSSYMSLAAGAFLVVAAGLGVGYRELSHRQELSAQELSETQKRLTTFASGKLATQMADLKDQLARTNSQMVAVKQKLTRTLESIGNSDEIYRIAKQTGVQVNQLTSKGIESQKLGATSFQILPLTVEVSGEVSNMVDFVLELNKLSAGLIRSVDMDIPQKIARPGEQPGPSERPSTIVELTLYSYYNGEVK
ncbi:MAG: hypothetical protein HYX87_07310 [Chloroflexi bacterium]|nr:hypothetical protein [Chloroflexota bacterium]